MNENRDDERFRSQYSTRTWRGCCIVPLIAVVGLLILTLAAGLFDRPISRQRPSGTEQGASHKQEFIEFGKAFFAIAQGADKINEQGFQALEKFSRQQGNAQSVKAVFRRASAANREAATKYKSLEIPNILAAQEKCREAVDKVGLSFTARQKACETIVRWADDPNNKDIAQEYARHAADVNDLTQEGLVAFADAAKANGVTDKDAHEFLPQSIKQNAMQFSNRIGEEDGEPRIRK